MIDLRGVTALMLIVGVFAIFFYGLWVLSPDDAKRRYFGERRDGD
jgi:hypothetical protein